MRCLLIPVLSATFLGGCATTNDYHGYRDVVVDLKGVDLYEYEYDRAECEDYAYDVRVGERTAGGAAEGAVVGGVIGAIAGDHHTAGRGAGIGAVLGGYKAHKRSRYEQGMIVRNCLRGRGYHVLN